jgi:hypothetical protein
VFRVRVPGLAVGELAFATIREVARNFVARKVWQPIAVSIPASGARRRTVRQTSPRSIGLSYKHVRDVGGVREYMKWCFDRDIEGILRRMPIEDEEIETLLSQRSKLPSPSQEVAGPLRHPYG